MGFLYVRPDESFMFGTVTGTVDAEYDADWLIDGRGNRPVRNTTNLSLTATAPAARTTTLIAVCNHNIPGTITVGGQAIGPATLRADGIYTNPYATVALGSISSLALSCNGSPAIIGELYAGTQRTLERMQLHTGAEIEETEPFEWEGDASSIPPYDPGTSDARVLRGEALVSDTGLADVRAWYLSTRRGTRPTLIVPIDTINDAWLVTFRYKVELIRIHPSVPAQSVHRVTFEFAELPRVRWP